MQPWIQTHRLLFVPDDGSAPLQWIVMVVPDPETHGNWWALRREDWPGEKGHWEFNLQTRRWFRLGPVPSLNGKKGDYRMDRLETMATPLGVKLLA